MKTLILGTAGHIDHGKTALVRALTGIDTDRLPEEKQRGITIDLGFANLRIGDVSFGIVDVPGHEDFIRNMLAGATGMDAVLLIVAADEGVMPQTREHLAILDLLNVQRGVVAITKCDLADADWTSLVVDDVHALLRATSLAGAPIIPVSARTGAGLDELRAAILEQALRPGGRRLDDLLRMPVDRVFTVRGTGTVVTGTIWSGQVSADANVRLLPADVRARTRSLQVHGANVAVAHAGERAALALSGVDKTAIERGAVVVDDAPWWAVPMLTARLRMIAGTSWTLQPRQRVRVHLGTAEVLARTALLDADVLQAEQQGWAQLRLEAPLLARVGDRLVIRSYSPVTTIAGGVVAELGDRKRTHLSAEAAALLARVVGGDAEQATLAVLARQGAAGVRAAELPLQTGHTPADITQALRTLGERVVRIGERCFAGDVVADAITAVIESVHSLHASNPLRVALDRGEVRAAFGPGAPELIEHAIDGAARAGAVAVRGSTIAQTGFQPTLSPRQHAQCSEIAGILETAGLAPPTVGELAQMLGDSTDLALLLRLLEHEGRLVALSPEFYIDASTLLAARERTGRELAGREGLTAAEFRATLPVSRKHLIPLLEHFDRTGLTVRQGDLRSVMQSLDSP